MQRMFPKSTRRGKFLFEISRLPMIFAIFPFGMSGEISRLSVPRLIFGMFWMSGLAYQGCYLAHANTAHFHGFTYILYAIQMTVPRFCVLFSTIWFVHHHFTLRKFALLLTRVEDFFSLNGYFARFPMSYSEETLAVIFLLIAVLNHLSIINTSPLGILHITSHYITPGLVLLQSNHFRLLVKYILVLLETLEKCLLSKPTSAGHVDKVLIQANRLFAAAELLNKLFALQCLLLIFCTFLFSTSNLYFIYTTFLKSPTFRQHFSGIYWMLVYWTATYHIVFYSAGLQKKVKDFNALLYQLMIADKTNKIAGNKKLRIHIIMERELVFTACGFFNLDYSLIHSMIAAGATYLIIFIQFAKNPLDLKAATAPGVSNFTIPEGAITTTTELPVSYWNYSYSSFPTFSP